MPHFLLGSKLQDRKAEILSIFMIKDSVKPHKIPAFYFDKQKSFVPKDLNE